MAYSGLSGLQFLFVVTDLLSVLALLPKMSSFVHISLTCRRFIQVKAPQFFVSAYAPRMSYVPNSLSGFCLALGIVDGFDP